MCEELSLREQQQKFPLEAGGSHSQGGSPWQSFVKVDQGRVGTGTLERGVPSQVYKVKNPRNTVGVGAKWVRG